MKSKRTLFGYTVSMLIMLLCLFSGCGAGRFVQEIQSDLYHQKETVLRIGRDVYLEMVYVDGGAFLMGSPSSEPSHRDNERPVRETQLDGFWIGKYEITQEQYAAIMGDNPSENKGDKLPVERVSWEDAMLFCEQLSEKTGVTFTLPTEAQWEFAARAGTKGFYAFGDCLSTDDANYDGTLVLPKCDEGEYRGETWVVGSGSANAWGLYDMHGNVWEWCLDWYADSYDENDLINPSGPEEGRMRVFRGGCWSSDALSCRSATRLASRPTARGPVVGFRVAVNIR